MGEACSILTSTKRAIFCSQALGAELRENTGRLVRVASCIGGFFAKIHRPTIENDQARVRKTALKMSPALRIETSN
jgi:hypothetical protein